MNFVVVEDSRAPLFSKELIAKFPSSSIVNVNTRTTSETLSFLDNKPLLTARWLVIIQPRVNIKIIELLARKESCINLVMATENTYMQKLSVCRSCGETSYVNMMSMNEENSVKYIMKNLDIDEDIAKILYTKCNKFLPYIEESILILKSLERKIIRSDIDLYIPKHNNLTPNSLFYHLVGLKELNRKSIVNYLYQYRYAFPYLKKRLLTLFTETEKLYKAIEQGDLGEDNVTDYCSEHKMEITPYMVKQVVANLYKSLTYDELFMKKMLINKVENTPTLLSIF